MSADEVPVYVLCTDQSQERIMNIKTIATVAAALIASSAWADSHGDRKCGAGTCGKKESSCKKNEKCERTEGAGGTTKEASCGKKEASCGKKDAACSKK